MHSPACSIHVPMAKRGQPVVLATIAPQLPSGPRLQWVARVKGQDPAALIDVRGASAFRTAGLYAFARPSPQVALFVFDPNADGPGWRYESWFVELDPYVEAGKTRRLQKHIVGDARVPWRGDVVEAMRRCELDTAAQFGEWLGGLL